MIELKTQSLFLSLVTEAIRESGRFLTELAPFFEILDPHFSDNPSPPILGESLRPFGAINRDHGTALQNQTTALVNKEQFSIVFIGKVLLIGFLINSENVALAVVSEGRSRFQMVR
jgi:hypothetical protein